MSSFFKKMGYASDTVKDIALNAISGNELFASDEEQETRMKICEGCPFFIKESKRCNECGCFQELKTGLKATKCPLGKW